MGPGPLGWPSSQPAQQRAPVPCPASALIARSPSSLCCVHFDSVPAILCSAIKEEHPKCRSDLSVSSLEVLWWVSYRLQIAFIFLVWHTRPLRRGLCLPAQLSALPLCTQMTPRPGHCGLFQVSCPCHTLTGSLHLCSRCLQHPPLTCLSGELSLSPLAPNLFLAFPDCSPFMPKILNSPSLESTWSQQRYVARGGSVGSNCLELLEHGDRKKQTHF